MQCTVYIVSQSQATAKLLAFNIKEIVHPEMKIQSTLPHADEKSAQVILVTNISVSFSCNTVLQYSPETPRSKATWLKEIVCSYTKTIPAENGCA